MQHREVYCIFTYGTFQSSLVQYMLFGREKRLKKAVLEDHCLYCEEDGFYSIYEEPGEKVTGSLLTVEKDELWIADQWEEIPFYEREIIQVKTDDGEIHAWAYFRKKNGRREKVKTMNSVSKWPEETLKIDLQLFLDYQKTNLLPKGDFYLSVTGQVVDEGAWISCKAERENSIILQKDHLQFMETALKWKPSHEITVIGNFNFYIEQGNRYRVPGAFYAVRKNKEITGILSFPLLLIHAEYMMESFRKNLFWIEEKNIAAWMEEAGIGAQKEFQGEYFVFNDWKNEMKTNGNLRFHNGGSEGWYFERMKEQVKKILKGI